MIVPQRLAVVPSRFTVVHLPQATFPEDDEWIALVRAPEGLTVVRDSPTEGPGERWVGFYGDEPHGTDVPGMLASIVSPLADAEISVFAASTFHGDLVLVPEHRQIEAIKALEEAGHTITRRS